MKKTLLALFAFLLLSLGSAHATVYYLCNAGGNYNASIWVTSTGAQAACTGGTTIAVGDTATLNSTSGQLTMNVATSVAVLNMSGYANTLALTTHALTVTTGPTTLGGTITATNAGGALILTAAQTITSNSVTIPNLLLGVAGTFPIVGNLSVSGNFVINGNYAIVITGAYNLSVANLLMGNNGTASLTIPAGQTLTVTTLTALTLGALQNAYGAPGTVTIQSSSTTPILFNYTGTAANLVVQGITFNYVNASGSNRAIFDYGATAGMVVGSTNIIPVNNNNFGLAVGS